MPRAKKISKSDFIRQHANLKANEVVAKAKEQGIKLAPTLVYKVRGRSGTKATKKPAQAAVKKSAAKVAAAKSAKPNASSFIRSLPATTPVAEVVTKGTAKGFKFKANLVYAVRSAATKKAGKGKPGLKAPASTKSNGGNQSVEARFVDLALDVGLARAEEMLARLRTRVRSIVL